MSDLPIVVRPFETAAERDAFYLAASHAFNPTISEDERLSNVAGRRERAESAPNYDPTLLRGAFRGETFLGGYRIQERRMQVGVARLLTCCIGAVVTHPDARLQGVATALMRDAIALARSRQNALLLLDGIAHFYHRFGYIDVFDITDHTINRALVLAQLPSPVTVRLATLDDAPAMLALYQRHYGPSIGSFERTATEYRYLLSVALSVGDTIALAVNTDGQPCGYLFIAREPEQFNAIEAAADSWPAALALLQYHAHMLETLPGPAPELCWRVSPDSSTLYLLADHLSVPDTSAWEGPAYGWSVKSQTFHHPDAGWMARVASLPSLAQAMLPEWQARWQRGTTRWSGALTLVVDGETCALALEGASIRLLDEPPAQARQVILSQQGLTQLLFGYRPLALIAAQPDHSIPADLFPVLEALFPPVHACIAGSDDF
ncbi:MAG TPA: GNAT family N-acetyltransferase [Ktedonobacterales bacterium]